MNDSKGVLHAINGEFKILFERFNVATPTGLPDTISEDESLLNVARNLQRLVIATTVPQGGLDHE